MRSLYKKGITLVSTRLRLSDFVKIGCIAFLYFASVLYWYSQNRRLLVLLLGFAASLFAIACIVAYKEKLFASDRNRFFLVVFSLAICCTACVLITPPFSVPDEMHHYFSAHWLADCILGQASIFDSSSFPMRSDDVKLYYDYSSIYISGNSPQLVFDNFSWLCGDSSIEYIESMDFSIGSENVIAKVGQVAGILLARALGLGSFPLFYLGRLLSAACYVILVGMAYRIMPFAKDALGMVALLPMSLHLAGSFSYDPGIIGLTFVLCALLFKMCFSEGVLRKRDIGYLILVVVLLAPCKIIYTASLFFLFFIPSSKFGSKKVSVLIKASVLFGALVSMMLVRSATFSGLSDAGSSVGYRGEESGEFFTMAKLLDDPLSAIAIYVRTIDGSGDFYWKTMLGYSLGWFQDSLRFPAFFVFAYMIIAAYSIQRDSNDGAIVPFGLRMGCIAVFCAVLFGAMSSMLLGWTFVDEDTIQGVQGRYLLPVLPLLIIACRSSRLSFSSPLLGFGPVAFIALDALYLIRFSSVAFL